MLPAVDSRDDEETLARLHEAELAGLSLDELGRARILDPLLESDVARGEGVDLRLLAGTAVNVPGTTNVIKVETA